jgi:hypothetical protein
MQSISSEIVGDLSYVNMNQANVATSIIVKRLSNSSLNQADPSSFLSIETYFSKAYILSFQTLRFQNYDLSMKLVHNLR